LIVIGGGAFSIVSAMFVYCASRTAFAGAETSRIYPEAGDPKPESGNGAQA